MIDENYHRFPDRVPAEDPNCPADVHAPSYRSWLKGGRRCVCPTVQRVVREAEARRKAYDKAKRARQKLRRTPGNPPRQGPVIDLEKADMFDVETALMGYPFRPYEYGSKIGISVHTEAALVLELCRRRWRSEKIGWLIRKDVRNVERIKSELRRQGHTYPKAATLVEEHGWREDPMLMLPRLRDTSTRRTRIDLARSYADAQKSTDRRAAA